MVLLRVDHVVYRVKRVLLDECVGTIEKHCCNYSLLNTFFWAKHVEDVFCYKRRPYSTNVILFLYCEIGKMRG